MICCQNAFEILSQYMLPPLMTLMASVEVLSVKRALHPEMWDHQACDPSGLEASLPE